MAGLQTTHSFSSSVLSDGRGGFVQSGSRAIFKSGITASNLHVANQIFAGGYDGINELGSANPLIVGSASNNTISECVVLINQPFKLTASGDFNHFTFIEKRIDGWFQISSGSQNGLVKKSFVDIEGKSTPGVYEYFVLAANTSSLKTVVRGTTVKVKS
jgi:hypothetical protein